MIKEDYVSFETAKLLKKKGFNEDSWFHYDANGDIVMRGYRLNMPEDIPAWTLQIAMKWLREVYHIFIRVIQSHIEYCACEIYYNSASCYTFTISFDSYEQACEAGIKYCLENLI